jgi:hypothetical protein
LLSFEKLLPSRSGIPGVGSAVVFQEAAIKKRDTAEASV